MNATKQVNYQIQVRGSWADGDSNEWRPAIAGTLNQTGLSDEEASTFATCREASDVLDELVRPQNPVEMRIVQVEVQR